MEGGFEKLTYGRIYNVFYFFVALKKFVLGLYL